VTASRDGWGKRVGGPLFEARRLRDELRVTHARIAALEAERTDYLRRDRRAGVLTHDAFRDAATAALRATQRRGEPASVLLVDIDGFRALNGRRGAEAGDEALAAVAHHVRDLVRPGDLVGRTGADELAVILPGSPLTAAHGLAERLVAVLEQQGPVTVSAGVAVDAGTGQLDGVLADAAAALDRARRAGGGRVGIPGRGGTADEPSRGAVGALALTLAEHDPADGEHAERVVVLAGAVARRLGLEAEEVEKVAVGALLHDLGSLSIPAEVLATPGPLTPAQRALVADRHLAGERILRAVPGLGPVARLVRHIGERYDGTGRPDGLRRDDIPLGSRIVAACEAYDAMLTPRPHRPALGHGSAVAELVAGAGTQFDPRVVEALLAHLAARRPLAAAA